MGKLHQLSKEYVPVHRRYGFFDKYNAEYVNALIPDSLSLLKERMASLIQTLKGLGANRSSFGMVHFDYCDGNYHIDFDTGQITVYDFDNACFFWYMYDLADLWINGTGWIAHESDAIKRKSFMDEYFETAPAGYRSETSLDQAILQHLPLFIKTTHMEGIIDYFECMLTNGEIARECEEWVSYRIKCLEDHIPYMGFCDDIYSCQDPFEYETRRI